MGNNHTNSIDITNCKSNSEIINDSRPISMDLGDNELYIPTNINEEIENQKMCLSNSKQKETNLATKMIEDNILLDKSPLLTPTQSVALSGALAGFLSGVIVCPLDVAKTRLQVQSFYYRKPNAQSKALKYKGILNTLETIVFEEGFKGLYNGLVPITLGYFPTWMIYFSVYEYSKKNLKAPFNCLDTEYGNHAISAITAGLISSTITNPIWVVKTRLMLQINQVSRLIVQSIDAKPLKPEVIPGQTMYMGTLDCFKKMYKQEGIRAFYSGLTPTLFGVVHVAIHFPLYEYCKHHIFNYKRFSNGDEEPTKHKDQFKSLFLSSCFSKMIATAITYPHEIIRTNLQIKDSSVKTLRGVIKYIWNGYGQSTLFGIWKFGNFYKGFGANLVRTVPASMITLISFEYFKDYLSEFT